MLGTEGEIALSDISQINSFVEHPLAEELTQLTSYR